MKLGYFMMPLHHIDRDYHTTLEEDAEAIIYADELGYSEAWVGEHYTSAVEPITSRSSSCRALSTGRGRSPSAPALSACRNTIRA